MEIFPMKSYFALLFPGSFFDLITVSRITFLLKQNIFTSFKH